MDSFNEYYNKDNDCDACLNQYLCGKYGDNVGCRCQDANEECTFVPDDIRQLLNGHIKVFERSQDERHNGL